MGKLDDATIKLYEGMYANVIGMKERWARDRYGTFDLDAKSTFWLSTGKALIEADRRIEEIHFSLKGEKLPEKDYAAEYRLHREELQRHAPDVRIYAVTNISTPRGAGRVTAFHASAGPAMTFPRAGSWVFVRSQGETGRAVFAPDTSGSSRFPTGIYTGAIGGCSAVAVLYGNSGAGLHNQFACATLAHLAGSNPNSVNWSQLYPLPRWQPAMAREPGRKVKAVVFADDPFAAVKCLDCLRERIGVLGADVMVYLSPDLSNCGVDDVGRFGITT